MEGQGRFPERKSSILNLYDVVSNTKQPELKTTCGINGDYSGRYIHWGIREHAMASISNGLAAYSKGTILPITSSFFMFYIVRHSLTLVASPTANNQL